MSHASSDRRRLAVTALVFAVFTAVLAIPGTYGWLFSMVFGVLGAAAAYLSYRPSSEPRD